MSAYYVNLVAINPQREELRTPPVRVLVDTGSELSWMPAETLVAMTGVSSLQAAHSALRAGKRRSYWNFAVRSVVSAVSLSWNIRFQ